MDGNAGNDMIEEYVRPAFQRIVIAPLARYAMRFPANSITLCGCALGILVIPAYTVAGALPATLFLLLSGLLDVLDGSVARLRGESSVMGSVYDILSDRVVESSAIIALYLAIPDSALICLLMMSAVLLCVTSFLLAAIHTPPDGEKSFHYSAGLMERAEAFIFFIAMMWLPAYVTALGLLFTVLVTYTAAKRSWEMHRHYSNHP